MMGEVKEERRVGLVWGRRGSFVVGGLRILLWEGRRYVVSIVTVLWGGIWCHRVTLWGCFSEEVILGFRADSSSTSFHTFSSQRNPLVHTYQASYNEEVNENRPTEKFTNLAPLKVISFAPNRKQYHVPLRSINLPVLLRSPDPACRRSIPVHPANISLPPPLHCLLLPSRFRYKCIECEPG